MTTCDHGGTNAPPKGTLFCPECDHRSRFDGDWTVVGTAGTDRYLCPECGAEITRRPSPDTDHGTGVGVGIGNRRAFERWRRAWERGLRAWYGFWYRTLAPLTDG